MKTRTIIAAIAFLMAFGLSAQNSNEGKSKKELRQERKEQRKLDREAYKEKGFDLLKEKNFVLRVDRASNAKSAKIVALLPNINFVKVAGDDVTVQFGNVSDIGMNGVGGVTYDGKLQKFEVFDRGEGKSAGVLIQYTSIYARNVISLYIEISGDQVSARFNESGTIINLYGQYEPYEGSTIWEATNRRDF